MYYKPSQQVTLCQVSKTTELENKAIFHTASLQRSLFIPRKTEVLGSYMLQKGKY